MANYAGFAVILILLAVVATACLLYFGNRKTFPWYVQVTCFIAWFFPFTIVFILPLDLSSVRVFTLGFNETDLLSIPLQTRYEQCLRLLDESRNSTGPPPTLVCEEPLGYVEHDFLWGFWDTVYWTSFNLTWFVIPLMLGYVRYGVHP
jgi:hypothetical protein